VQTTLLGLAILIIVALVSALVAPLVVDWNVYRSTFEQEASRLAGFAVHVRGQIDARILPAPHITLREVDAGPERQPWLRAQTVELEVGLGPLIRGELQATSLRLVAPQISIGLTRAGALDWPAAASPAHPDVVSISRFEIEDGRVTLGDAASGSHLALRKVFFKGDVRALPGPFRGEGSFVAGDELYGYRISGNRPDGDSGLKLRLGIDPSNHPLTAEIDGMLKVDRGVPGFQGALTLERPVGAALASGARVINDPVRLTGKVQATPVSATIDDVQLQYGPDDRPINFAGKAEVVFGAHPHLYSTVSSRQLDLDRALAAPDLTHRPPFVLLKDFAEVLVGFVKPPLPITAGIAIDALTIGGTTLQALTGKVIVDDKGWSVRDVSFRAPGASEIDFSGQLDAGKQGLVFRGPATLTSADVKALMAWLEGGQGGPSGPSEALVASADISVAGDRFALDRLAATLGQENIDGRLAYTWAAGDQPAALDGELHAATLNVDALTAFAKAALLDRAPEIPRRVAVVLDVGRATFAGVDAQKINTQLKLDSGILRIDRMSIGDLGGAALDVSGSVEQLSSQPRGRFTVDLDARTLAGLTETLRGVTPQAAEALRPFADRLAPAKVHAVLSFERAGNSATLAKLDLGGTVGAMRLTLNAEGTGEAARPAAAAIRVAGKLDADDGGALTRLLALDRVLAVDQLPGQMTLSASGPLGGDVHVNALAAAGGFSATADGVLHLTAQPAPTGRLQVKATAADLKPLRLALTGQPGDAVPVAASAVVGIAGADLSVTDLSMTAGKSAVRGRLHFKLANPLGVGGEIEADQADVPAMLAMLTGTPSAAGGAWSPDPFGHGAFGAQAGDVGFVIHRAALTPALALRDFKGTMRFAPPAITLSNLDGGMGGGRLSGELSLQRNADEVSARGRFVLTGANPDLAFASKRNGVDGQMTLTLQGDGTGLSPVGLIGSLHGSGKISLRDAHFGGIDTAAFNAAVHASEDNAPLDAAKIRAAVNASMDGGRLVVPQADAELTMAGGQITIANATLRAQGGATLSLSGVLDLKAEAIDANLKLTQPPPATGLILLPPELTVAVKGPLAAPERTLDLAALMGWLTLRTTEQQTRRLESIEANRRNDDVGSVMRPASPAIRFIPAGVALETANRIDAASLSGPRSLDRMRPEASAESPSSHVDPSHVDPGHADQGSASLTGSAGPANPASPAVPRSDKPNTTAGTARASTPSLLRLPLDLLFHSQN
jgi:uncharacterized protein involved in outer membrane biogenesis